ACAGGLRSVVDLPEFLTAREKSLKPQKRPQVVEERINIVQELFSGLKLSKMSVFISLLLIGLSFIASLPKMKPLQLEIQKLKETHPQLTSVTPEMNYEEILEIERNSRLKLERIKSSLKEKRSLARIFKIIAQNKPYGVWLNQISFSPSIFSIKGMVYLEDSNREIESVNEFVTSLKKDAYFSKYFSEIELVSLERNEYLGKAVMTFIINCRAKKIE
ncbi:MAG: PilN domain-containing protein, partial [Candidatus Omnitrophica bacterium]|nr:PilN domain-containing protein [Candidatus Omnitrophota bacterium]